MVIIEYLEIKSKIHLRINCGEKSPVHCEHLAAVLDGASGQVGHVADVQVGIGTSQIAKLVWMNKNTKANINNC